MELRQLRYFVTVAEVGHFGRAAEALHIVQPAVSQQVARLEREVGFALFDRSHRRTALTPEGLVFLPYARQVLDAAEGAARAAAELRAGERGLLRIGSSQALGPRLDAILTAFRHQHPEASVELRPLSTPAKLAAVVDGSLDVAFVRAAQPTVGVDLVPLWEEPLAVAVPVQRAPTAGGVALSLGDLADLPAALAERADNPGVFDLVVAACREAGFSPRPGPPFTTVQDVLAAGVAAGRCWTVLYAATPAADLPAGVEVRPARPPMRVPTGLAVASGDRRPLLRSFVDAALRAGARPAWAAHAGRATGDELPDQMASSVVPGGSAQRSCP